jgi:hypothetical protein
MVEEIEDLLDFRQSFLMLLTLTMLAVLLLLPLPLLPLLLSLRSSASESVEKRLDGVADARPLAIAASDEGGMGEARGSKYDIESSMEDIELRGGTEGCVDEYRPNGSGLSGMIGESFEWKPPTGGRG